MLTAATTSRQRGGIRGLAEGGNRERTVGGEHEVGIVGDLPEMAVRIREVPGIAAVERCRRRPGDRDVVDRERHQTESLLHVLRLLERARELDERADAIAGAAA